MGGNHLYESADVVYQCPAGTSLLPYDEGDRRVCCKSDDGVHGLGDRLLRRETGLTPEKANVVNVPVIKESPVNIECRVVKVEELGSHHMFIADVVAVDVDEAYMDEKDTFHLSMAKPLAYSHGRYYGMGEELGSFGYSVRKRAQRLEEKLQNQRKKPEVPGKFESLQT